MSVITSEAEVYTVSQLNQRSRLLLENEFPQIWVEGEISNLAQPNSGHIYFSLKDEGAQVRCAMFRGFNQMLPFKPKDGMQVLVRAKVSLYAPRGDYQLIVERMEEAGDGALQRAFNALKKKLQKEGLFAEAHKKPLPAFPKQVGVITSATGAALRDILTTLHRRFPLLPVMIYPSDVQGKKAAGQLAAAIKVANQRKECDVLILARGGGSLEDLWPFNEEIVARAVYTSELPIVTGVGHEIDFTIVDFIADLRAATPTAAAEAISPEQSELQSLLLRFAQRISSHMLKQLQLQEQQLHHISKRLRHPGDRLRELMQRTDELQQRLVRSIEFFISKQVNQVENSFERLQQFNPKTRIEIFKTQLQNLQHNLDKNMQQALQHYQERLQFLAATLDTISPLATISRGYSIVKNKKGRIIKQISDTQVGEEITTRVNDGTIHSSVLKITELEKS